MLNPIKDRLLNHSNVDHKTTRTEYYYKNDCSNRFSLSYRLPGFDVKTKNFLLDRITGFFSLLTHFSDSFGLLIIKIWSFLLFYRVCSSYWIKLDILMVILMNPRSGDLNAAVWAIVQFKLDYQPFNNMYDHFERPPWWLRLQNWPSFNGKTYSNWN